jgi:hypothetical protein
MIGQKKEWLMKWGMVDHSPRLHRTFFSKISVIRWSV